MVRYLLAITIGFSVVIAGSICAQRFEHDEVKIAKYHQRVDSAKTIMRLIESNKATRTQKDQLLYLMAVENFGEPDQ